MRKAFAGIALALSITVPTLVAAPAEAETQTPRLSVTDNKGGFNQKTNGAFVITVHARHQSGANMAGRGWLYINGDRIAGRFLHRGWVQFKVGRDQLRNNKTSAIKVRIDPRNGDIAQGYVTRHIKDRVPRRSAGSTVVDVARAQVGDRYAYGGAGPSAFDCSGLTAYAWRRATGKVLPHSSAAQRRVGRQVSRSEARPGDLVYTPGHIALYAGDGKVIEAATPATGVVMRKMWQRGPVFIRP